MLRFPIRGGIPHLAAELFRERSGAELTYVFYPGSAQAMSDLISGQGPDGVSKASPAPWRRATQVACSRITCAFGDASQSPDGGRNCCPGSPHQDGLSWSHLLAPHPRS